MVSGITVSDGIAMKCSLGESPPTFMRPLLIWIYPSLGNNSFQDSEVAQLVIPAHCKCVDKSILELQIHLPKGEELTLCILTVKAEHRPKQKHLVCVGGNLGQWYRTTSHTLAGMCHTLKRVLNIRWDNRETLSQLAFCSALSAHPTLLWMPLQYFPFGKILSLLNLPLIQWSSCRSPCSAGESYISLSGSCDSTSLPIPPASFQYLAFTLPWAL